MTQNTLLGIATTYEQKSNKTKNIAELGIVDLSLPVVDDEVIDKVTGAKKIQKVLLFNGEKYRIPSPVLEEIKKLVEMTTSLGIPAPKKVRVERTGKTQTDTRYKVGAVKE